MSGIPHWCFVGAKVVCVDDTHPHGYAWCEDAPTVGMTYTVSRVWRYPVSIDESDGEIVVELAEIGQRTVASAVWKQDIGYGLYRFRPLVSQEDDVAMFQRPVTDMTIVERLDRLAEILDAEGAR